MKNRCIFCILLSLGTEHRLSLVWSGLAAVVFRSTSRSHFGKFCISLAWTCLDYEVLHRCSEIMNFFDDISCLRILSTLQVHKMNQRHTNHIRSNYGTSSLLGPCKEKRIVSRRATFFKSATARRSQSDGYLPGDFHCSMLKQLEILHFRFNRVKADSKTLIPSFLRTAGSWKCQKFNRSEMAACSQCCNSRPPTGMSRQKQNDAEGYRAE